MSANKIGFIDKTKDILKEKNFFIKKKFGQNFLVDQNILNNIASCADITKDTCVIEIGPGLGSLTEILAKKAKKVLCYEIDSELIPILNENLKEYDNIQIINKDILKVDIKSDLEEIFPQEKDIILVANLPYYITTPIILGLLEKTTLIRKYVMMMQLEVADRICSKPDVKDYNALSIAIQYRAKATKEMHVSNKVFIPAPAVDSAVIKLELYDDKIYSAFDEQYFFKLVRQSFAQRRKTLVNNLINMDISKQDIYDALDKLNIANNIRSEALSVADFVNLSNILSK